MEPMLRCLPTAGKLSVWILENGKKEVRQPALEAGN